MAKTNYIFSNVLGAFVFDEKFEIIDSVTFKSLKEFIERAKAEKKLSDKYGAKKPSAEQMPEILSRFSPLDKQFYKLNMEITRSDLKSSVTKDLFVIHAINSIEESDKIINAMSKRLREWYELYCPEASKEFTDNKIFAEQITQNNKWQILKKASVKNSMGADLSDADLAPILDLARNIIGNFALRDSLEVYIKGLMQECCPNVLALTGALIGARLIRQAGDLKRLAMMSASTIQLLGAEKALFRHIKTGARCPKYGHIINHPLVARAKKDDKGKVARALADKISIATRIDYYKGDFIGDDLLAGLKKRFS